MELDVCAQLAPRVHPFLHHRWWGDAIAHTDCASRSQRTLACSSACRSLHVSRRDGRGLVSGRLETAREGQNQQDQQDQAGKSPADAWSTGVEASASQHYQKNDQDHKHAHGVTFRKMDSSPVNVLSETRLSLLRCSATSMIEPRCCRYIHAALSE